MPGGDRTGPEGMGPMTGRSAGYCAGFNAPGYMQGRGGGRFFRSNSGGRFHGRGRRRFLPAEYPVDPEYSREILENRMELLKREMDYVQNLLNGQKGAQE